MTIIIRWNNAWVRVVAYLVVVAAYLAARTADVHFVYQGF